MLFAIFHPIVYKYCVLPRKSDARSYECFAPWRRTLFQHLNFQKCSDNSVLLTFWLRNVLRTTAACNFWYLAGPNGSAPAALASLLLDLPEPQNIGKRHTVSRLLPFRALLSFFFFLSSLTSHLWSSFCWPSLLWLFLFSDCSHNCCCICPCRKFDF